MSVEGVYSVDTALLQSALSTSAVSSTSQTDAFGGVLSDALARMQGGTGGQTSQEYDMYADLIDESAGSSSALGGAISAASFSAMPTMMLLSLFSAMSGNKTMPLNTGAAMAGVESGSVTDKPWLTTDPAITSTEANRSAGLYNAVIRQFDVENNPRYSTSQGGTYCNIFLWDVTSAMGAEIPHYYNAQTGEPMERGEAGASQMTANGIYSWLGEHGEEYGWYEVSAEDAQAMANRGMPVVTALYRGGAHGHVQMVCPSRDGGYDAEKGVTIAQAGKNLTEYTSISNIFRSSLSRVKYYAHR